MQKSFGSAKQLPLFKYKIHASQQSQSKEDSNRRFVGNLNVTVDLDRWDSYSDTKAKRSSHRAIERNNGTAALRTRIFENCLIAKFGAAWIHDDAGYLCKPFLLTSCFHAVVFTRSQDSVKHLRKLRTSLKLRNSEEKSFRFNERRKFVNCLNFLFLR